MTQRRAAAPYAKALFALAKERNQTELVGRELGDSGGRDRFLALVGLQPQTIKNGGDREPPRSVASVGEAALLFSAGENESPP